MAKATGSWRALQKRNAKANRKSYFLVAKGDPVNPQHPLSLQKDGTWGGFYEGKLFLAEPATKMQVVQAEKLGERVWTVQV